MSAQQRKKEFEGARDPITLSVIYNRLLTINQEMGITMINTSISPIFAEVHDFSCAICDWDEQDRRANRWRAVAYRVRHGIGEGGEPGVRRATSIPGTYSFSTIPTSGERIFPISP